MATRNVVVATAASNTAKRVTTTATTWGELKAQSDVASLISGDVEAIVNPGKITLGHNDSILPTGDFQLFLIPKKNKAGYADYSAVVTALASAIRVAASKASDDDVNQLKEDLIEVVADHFGLDADEIGGGSTRDSELDSAVRMARELAGGR